MRMVPAVCAAVALCALMNQSSEVRSHTLLDPEIAHAMLMEIAGYRKSASSEPDQEARAGTLFKLGGRVRALVDLLNQDLFSHGGENPLARLLAKRLDEYEVRIAYSESNRRYGYDQGSFRQYLKLAPNGPHAADARFYILSETFRATIGLDQSVIAPADRPTVINAISEKERFLKDYPDHSRVKEVSFFLGVDCYRLSRTSTDPEQTERYERCARKTLERVAKDYPASVEARAASALIDALSNVRRK